MKVIKTALGWEIRPENNNEESHVRWLINSIASPWALEGVLIKNENCPKDTIIPHDTLMKVAQRPEFRRWMEIE